MTLRYCYVISGTDPATRVMGFMEGTTSGAVEQWVRQAFFDRWGYRCTTVKITSGEFNA